MNHESEITKVEFSLKQDILASSCAGGKIIIWDLSKIGSETTNVDSNDGPPEMMVSKIFKLYIMKTNFKKYSIQN